MAVCSSTLVTRYMKNRVKSGAEVSVFWTTDLEMRSDGKPTPRNDVMVRGFREKEKLGKDFWS